MAPEYRPKTINDELAQKKGRRIYAVAALFLLILALGLTVCMIVCGIIALYYLFFSKNQPPSAILFPIIWVLNLRSPRGHGLPFISWENAQVSKSDPAFRIFLAIGLGVFMSLTFTGLIFSTLSELTGREFKLAKKLESFWERSLDLLDMSSKRYSNPPRYLAYIIIGGVVLAIIAITWRLLYQSYGGR